MPKDQRSKELVGGSERRHVTLADAFEQIEKGGVKGHTDGLKDLRHILSHNKNKFTIRKIEDYGFHAIYETLFKVAVLEKSTWLKSTTKTSRTATEDRLSSCAYCLRQVVEVGTRTLKLKTVRALIDHAIHTLPLSSGAFCAPLALDYAKYLKALLSHQPHVEHLQRAEWERAVSFCVTTIKAAENDAVDNEAIDGAEATSYPGTVHDLSYPSSRSHAQDSASQAARSLAKQVTEEMISCLASLTAAPNASISSEQASPVMWVLVDFLKTNSVVGRSDAFAAVNNVLAWARTEDVALTQKATNHIIRLVRNFWTMPNAPILRKEMLVALLYLRPYIERLLRQAEGRMLRTELAGLLDVMRAEYGGREYRKQLLLDDLSLPGCCEDSASVRVTLLALKPCSGRAEYHWTWVNILGFLTGLLTLDDPELDASNDDDDDEISSRPRKRQRTINELDELLSASVDGLVDARRCALQTLLFLTQQKPLSVSQLAKVVDKVSSVCDEDAGNLSSWSFLVLAGCAAQVQSTDPDLTVRWSSVWQLGCRAMANTTTCRAACYLLDIMLQVRLVVQEATSELIQTVTFSIGVNGPSVLADSVANLLSRTITISQQSNPGITSSTAESVLSWLLRNFVPSRFEEKAYTSNCSLYTMWDFTHLVGTCLNRQLHKGTDCPLPVWDLLAQRWLACQEQHDLISYLLLTTEQTQILHTTLTRDANDSSATSSPPQARQSCEMQIINHLTADLQKTLEQWEQLCQERASSISLEMFKSLCNACSILVCLSHCHVFRDIRRQDQLQKQVSVLLQSICKYAGESGCSQDKADVMLLAFSQTFAGLCRHGSSAPHNFTPCEKAICLAASRSLSSQYRIQDMKTTFVDEDDMEVDFDLDSQESHHDKADTAALQLKNDAAVQYSGFALRSSTILYTSIVKHLHCEDASVSASARVVTDILSTPGIQVLACRVVLSSLPRCGIIFSPDETERLMEFFTEELLSSYLYERSEVATGTILDVMSTLTSVWSDSSYTSLFHIGLDMYDWFTKTALSAAVFSPTVQRKVATLLIQLCDIDTEYGKGHEVPSVLITLYKLLQLGNVTVLYHLASRITTIFGRYILSKHGIMFDELQTYLPAEADWIEGLAMRLLFLAKLAAAWPSLLRSCVYYMFETAALIKTSTQHAARCIVDLTSSLDFGSPQELFRLFAPQLLHTFLENRTLGSLPFAAFQYASLRDLLQANQIEITAQSLMRGNDAGLHFLSTSLETSTSDLVEVAFAKCVAYATAWDIAQPQVDGKTPAEADSRVRKHVVSKERWKQLIVEHFPVIMGNFYVSMNELDDTHDTWLDKKDRYQAASRALSECKSYSHSTREAAHSQQPSFKSKRLCDQIERLCRRTDKIPNTDSHDPVKPWDVSSFPLAVRMLLDSIHNALGSLHKCVVLRKLRLLVCMAGSTALSGFPLEMLLHSIRPLLNDTLCADDAIGLLHYLLQHGQRYLVTDALSFTNGVIMLMILQMRMHSATDHDSTTQESQHTVTLRTMLLFQTWLIKYMQHCHGSGVGSEGAFYVALTKALADSHLPGNAEQGSEESKLLLLLLDQFGMVKPLLPHADSKEALSLLSAGFCAPSSIASDCLGGDQDSTKYASTIWKILRTSSLDSGFSLWAAGVIGRAYVSTGVRPSSLVSDVVHGSGPFGALQEARESQAVIARKLSHMIGSRDRVEASLADHTLRLVFSTFADSEEAIAFQQMLPISLVPAMEKGSYSYVPREALNQETVPETRASLQRALHLSLSTADEPWMVNLAITLCRYGPKSPILPALPAILRGSSTLAVELLPAVIHLALLQEQDMNQVLKEELSHSMTAHFTAQDPVLVTRQRFMLDLLLYLRGQPWPGEATQAKRLEEWLEVDYVLAAKAATRCNMATAALLMAESIPAVETISSKRKSRASALVPELVTSLIPDELLLDIFKQVEEPDSFYGVPQPASLGSVLDRLDYERDGFKSLMFRSAQMDGSMQMSHGSADYGSAGIVHSLSALSFNSLTYSLLSGKLSDATETTEEMFDTARKLQQWDLGSPETLSGPAATSFAVLQQLSHTSDLVQMKGKLASIILEHIQAGLLNQRLHNISSTWYATLATLTETREILDVSGDSTLMIHWESMLSRQGWMQAAPFMDGQSIMSNRQTLFSVIAQNKDLLNALHIGVKACKATEIKALIATSQFARSHGVLQEALSASTQVSLLARQAKDLGLRVEAAAKFETASVLWDLGETTASVNMLRDMIKKYDSEEQDIVVGRPGLLAQTGHQLAGARLEKPDDIKSEYLEPAIRYLQGRHTGREAGKVYFEFASFCDQQLQNPGNIEDFNRMAKIRQNRQAELDELLSLKRGKKDNEKKYLERSYEKADSWFRVDDAEYQRLKASRDASIQSSLQNYLLALQASDSHDICVLRFFALWLENAEHPHANDVVGRYLPDVPSWKFVLLLNQLMSRLENISSPFQKSLKHLLKRMCKEHPYHSLHYLYASTRKPASSDGAAYSRYQAASIIRQEIQKIEVEPRLRNFFLANGQYNLLAQTPNPASKSNKIPLKDFPDIPSKTASIQGLHVPPATISLPLQPDGDYSGVPTVTGFGPQVMIMSGLSAPKVLTVRASDGREFKQLFKGGHDDLRQDAIMEQVFEEVSKMLRKHKLTRQRNLQVRTYKVIPLTTRSGIIEFVPNSMPINDFLGPAHQRYWPGDLKADAARNKISGAAKNGSVSDRVKVFRQVCDHLHPVMRHFFLERFINPDEWFEKRTAYTRTTASVSILGHVLGLGDRHCHNILLDEKSGEAIHIDLGVAFEAGRVLPIPELVPFRMTRDIVDGMGITKTEGVFRRCCEFTMDALREDKDSIMTLLNVLRYDPLVNWTLSPVRAKRMQDAQETGRNVGNGDEGSSKKREQDAGEADRALAIVEKKLSTTLSTAATVNELIQAATDEKHLATLFHGWAAFY